jgi:pyruvate kinase
MSGDSKFRSTKIIATIGPSSSTFEAIRDLAYAGVDVFRLSDRFTNVSTRNQTLLDKINRASIEVGRKLGIMLHLKEADIRLRVIGSKKFSFFTGDVAYITTNRKRGADDRNWIYTDNSDLTEMVEREDKLYVDYGKLVLEVVGVYNEDTI